MDTLDLKYVKIWRFKDSGEKILIKCKNIFFALKKVLIQCRNMFFAPKKF